jgi:hypothetical protein
MRRVGVVVGIHVNLQPDEADAVAAELGTALRTALPVDVIAGAEATRRLPAEGISQSCVAELECRLEVGRRLDADELLILVMVRMGDAIQIDATWADISSGKTASRPAIELAPGSDHAAVFANNAALLLPHVKEARGPDKPQIVVVTTPTTPTGGRHMTTGAWVASGVGLAALTGATVLGLSAKRAFDDLDTMGCRDMPCPKSDIDSLGRRALAADVLFGVTAAAAATAVVLYLRSDSGERAAATQPTIGVSEDALTVGLGGSF